MTEKKAKVRDVAAERRLAAKKEELEQIAKKRRADAIVRIAKACHEVNKLFCELLGDRSQAPWEKVEPEIQMSAIDGVEAILDGRVKEPGDSHANWLAFKEKEGWTYGEEKDLAKKEHPCMVDFEDLPEEQQAKDKLFLIVAKHGIKANEQYL